MVESLEQLFSQALENFQHWLHEDLDAGAVMQ